MIRVIRAPEVLQRLAEKGAEEQAKAAAAFAQLQIDNAAAVAAGEEPKRFSFTFKRYKDQEVKSTLEGLFHGKCAYCESFYSSTQPMDVEHYRPKGAVAEDKDHPGYFWLAATWQNLLPSCIDCNRKRTQDDAEQGEERKLGKKDQFPVGGDRAMKQGDPLPPEMPRLLDPCVDDPDEYFVYDIEQGFVFPREDDADKQKRAEESIRVYGLNRSSLVTDRLHVLRLIHHHLEVVGHLTGLRDRLDTPQLAELKAIVDDVISLELRAIFAMRDPARPYAGMARQVIRELAPDPPP